MNFTHGSMGPRVERSMFGLGAGRAIGQTMWKGDWTFQTLSLQETHAVLQGVTRGYGYDWSGSVKQFG